MKTEKMGSSTTNEDNNKFVCGSTAKGFNAKDLGLDAVV